MEAMTSEREAFEKWYAENAFDYERNPIGSRDCGLQWKAWQARAHLAKPAQAVDVVAIHNVIRQMRNAVTDVPDRAPLLNYYADELTPPSPARRRGRWGMGCVSATRRRMQRLSA